MSTTTDVPAATASQSELLPPGSPVEEEEPLPCVPEVTAPDTLTAEDILSAINYVKCADCEYEECCCESTITEDISDSESESLHSDEDSERELDYWEDDGFIEFDDIKENPYFKKEKDYVPKESLKRQLTNSPVRVYSLRSKVNLGDKSMSEVSKGLKKEYYKSEYKKAKKSI
jgi:hypothetical protein